MIAALPYLPIFRQCNQMLLLERADNHGEAYFFNGVDINPAHVAAQAVVQVQSPDRENTNSPVVYVVQQGVEPIQSIQFAGKQLVFVSNGLPTRAAKSVRSFYGGNDKWATVVQTNYQGEPALRFHVVHNPFPHVCQEYLYVTRSHVASEVAPNSPQSSCETFSTDIFAGPIFAWLLFCPSVRSRPLKKRRRGIPADRKNVLSTLPSPEHQFHRKCLVGHAAELESTDFAYTRVLRHSVWGTLCPI